MKRNLDAMLYNKIRDVDLVNSYRNLFLRKSFIFQISLFFCINTMLQDKDMSQCSRQHKDFNYVLGIFCCDVFSCFKLKHDQA